MSRFITFRNERDVSEFVRRAHDLPDDVDSAVIDRAVEDLLRRNPHLRDLSHVARGDVVEVPPFIGDRGGSPPAPTIVEIDPHGPIDRDKVMRTRIERAKEMVGLDKAQRARGAAEAKGHAKGVLDALKDPAVQPLRATALMRERLRIIEGLAAKRLAALEKTRTVGIEAQAVLEREIVALDRAMNGQPPV